MTYTEDALIEQPAINLFLEMQWRTLDCYAETMGEQGLLGRETRSDVVLVRELRQALKNINPHSTTNEIDQAIEVLNRDFSAMTPVAANQHCYQLLKEGVKVKSDAYAQGEEADEFITLKVIDWQTASNNDFLLCSQLWITGEIETRRPDLVGFVNGLPLLFVELKAASRNLIHAYKDNLADYKKTIPQLFWFNQLIILSNGVRSRVGTLTSQWEHFAEWRKVKSENEPRSSSLETVLRGTCEPERFLDLIENFILFENKKATVKIVAKYHQYLGVNQALEGLKHIRHNQGKLGVFWHTQGSGKSFSMVFFCQKAFRKIEGNWTFVIVTDRKDLDDQIYTTFSATGLLNSDSRADSALELKQLLSEDHRYVFTLIHKFRTEQGESYPMLSERDDVVVMTDEAHRSQYSTLALNMRTALPNAGFLAFTGTPLLGKKGELDDADAKTYEVFGDYVSVYNFADAIDDGATLPLYYENRVPEVNLNRDDLGEEIKSIIADADLSDESEAKIEREFAKAYHIITRDDRLETIAHDMVEHFMGREPFSSGMRGKAMMIAIDKATAIKMYNKVQVAWRDKIAALKQQALEAEAWQKAILEEDIAYMESTDMAVVVSSGLNDDERLARKGLDYQPHRERMVKENLDEKFKDPTDPLRIVFVCAMWLTGFDAPCVSTLYLDKPLKRHTLMQTIARANRVFPGKTAGQVVDYINIFGALQEALGVYGGSLEDEQGGYGPSDTPAESKQELLAQAKTALAEAITYLQSAGVDTAAILAADAAKLEKQMLIQAAVETLMEPKRLEQFAAHVRRINRIFKALLPDAAAVEFLAERALLNFLLKTILEGMGEQVDDDDVLHVVRTQVDALLDDAITTIEIKPNLPSPVNIADIDFDALAQMLERTKKPSRADAERLKRLVQLRIEPMVGNNPTRIDFQERFNEIVASYNLGASSAEEFFEKLKSFIDELNEEDKRAAREGLKEPELTLFDLLSQGISLSENERNKVKALAKELLEKLESVLVIDWRKRQRTKARVQKVIDDILQQLPESYDDESWELACDKVFMHVYDKHPGGMRSAYA